MDQRVEALTCSKHQGGHQHYARPPAFSNPVQALLPPSSVLSAEKGYRGGDSGGKKITAPKQSCSSVSQQQCSQAGKLLGEARQQQAPAVGAGQWNSQHCPRLPTSMHVKGPASTEALSSWGGKSWSMTSYAFAGPSLGGSQASDPFPCRG